MDKVYVVQASSGKWDDYYEWIHGIYMTPTDAEESKRILINEMNVKIVPAPFPVDEYGDLIDENLSEEDMEKYDRWWHTNHDAKEFNGAEVKEYEIGKPYIK